MAINPGGASNYSWNYSKPDKPGYSTQLVGTVLAIQEVQKMKFSIDGNPGGPDFWPDGNPKMNIRLALVTQEGEIKTFTFQPAGKAARAGQKKSVHMDLFHLTNDTDMMNLIGKTLCIQTQEGRYGQGNPRPWFVSLVDTEPFKLNGPLPPEFKAPRVLANGAASGGRMNAPQQQQPMYQMPQPVPFQPRQQQGFAPVYQQPQPQPMNLQNAQLNQFDSPDVNLSGEQKTNLQLLMGVPLDISVEIGSARRKVKEILEFTQGTIIELERQAGAPVDIIVNGNLIAKGDIVVIDDNFAVRITEIMKSKLMDSINKE